jgi:excisionase family DNA binding protein
MYRLVLTCFLLAAAMVLAWLQLGAVAGTVWLALALGGTPWWWPWWVVWVSGSAGSSGPSPNMMTAGATRHTIATTGGHVSATAPTTDDATTPIATLGAAAAARALGVRRETVYRLWREGKLPFVTERDADGQERRRVPVAAVEERLGEVGRGPQATTPRTASVTPKHVAGHTDGHYYAPDVVSAERLLLAEKTASTLRAQLAAERALIEAAAARLEEPVKAGWLRRRRAERERLAEAATALRQLAALPADTADEDDR